MRRKQASSFVDQARNIIDDNIHVARFNETQRNLDKLKSHYIDLVEENKALNQKNEQLNGVVRFLKSSNDFLKDRVDFLDEIINSLQIIVSIKDLDRGNLLWYNLNYQRMLGYKHKELQGLNSEDILDFYHPDDHEKIEYRKKFFAQTQNNRHMCTVRMKHKNGKWITLNSDYIVIERNADGSLSKAIEILSNVS